MVKTITFTIEVPEWVDEIKLKEEMLNLVKDLSDKYYKVKRLRELASELDFDEREFEEFQKSREEAWKEIKREYKL